MKFGGKFGSGFGSPENRLSRFEVTASGPMLNVLVQTRADCDDAWFNLDVNSRLSRYEYLKAGEVYTFSVPKVAGTGSRQVVTCICSGHSPESVQRSARYYDGLTSRRITHVWPWLPTVLGSLDTMQDTAFSGWSLNGLDYHRTQPVTGQTTRRTLQVLLDVSGEDCTLEIRDGTTVLASGTGTRGAVITLSGEITGSVTVAADAADTAETLTIAWPSSMIVKRGLSDPPTAVVANVAFSAENEIAWTETADLQAGQTYYYRFIVVSDTGQEGTESETVTVTLSGAPGSPTGLAWYSGTADSPMVSLNPSSTSGVTYRAYIQKPADTVMPTDPADATFNEQDGKVYADLPALPYDGISYVIVRAVKNGTEDRNADTLGLEFDTGGMRVAPRPNDPTIKQVDVTDGRTATVTIAYPVAEEKGVATHVHVYVDNALYDLGPSSSSSSSSSSDVQAVAGSFGAEWNGVREATAVVTLPANGSYLVKVYSVTDEDTESAGYAEETVYVSDVQPPAMLPDGYNARG